MAESDNTAAPIPVTLHLVQVATTEDGGDGKPWTRWSLVGEAAGAAEAIVTSWAKADATQTEVLAAVFLSLRMSGGPFGGLA